MTVAVGSLSEPTSDEVDKSYILMVSSEPPDTATEPATATDLIGERCDGKEKIGDKVRVSVECFRVLSLNPQMNRSYDPATRLISADFDRLFQISTERRTT